MSDLNRILRTDTGSVPVLTYNRGDFGVDKESDEDYEAAQDEDVASEPEKELSWSDSSTRGERKQTQTKTKKQKKKPRREKKVAKPGSAHPSAEMVCAHYGVNTQGGEKEDDAPDADAAEGKAAEDKQRP
ncbi:hypothetical protein PHYPSEUDO_011649 [Phytophthora pseudosyringae]|uniref:Uncharacterized protein n=1 Tax=Phytophthora pseudosyringae TaxID=221518 RepID=A0A8T1VAX7_9STRA|nr:hypothetical protein PHYPSEUDO_011649 [Phytophthora pseudosyringae]